MADEKKQLVTQKDIGEWLGEYDSDLMELTLKALQMTLSRRFVESGYTALTPEKIMFGFTPNHRQQIKLMSSGKRPTVPWIYLAIERVDIDKTQGNVKTWGRSGIMSPTKDGKNDFMIETKAWRVNIAVQLSYVDSDARRMMRFGTELALKMTLGAFTFTVDYADFPSYDVVVSMPEASFSAPGADRWVELDDENTSNIQTIQVPLLVSSLIASQRQVPRVRSSQMNTSLGERPSG